MAADFKTQTEESQYFTNTYIYIFQTHNFTHCIYQTMDPHHNLYRSNCKTDSSIIVTSCIIIKPWFINSFFTSFSFELQHSSTSTHSTFFFFFFNNQNLQKGRPMFHSKVKLPTANHTNHLFFFWGCGWLEEGFWVQLNSKTLLSIKHYITWKFSFRVRVSDRGVGVGSNMNTHLVSTILQFQLTFSTWYCALFCLL